MTVIWSFRLSSLLALTLAVWVTGNWPKNLFQLSPNVLSCKLELDGFQWIWWLTAKAWRERAVQVIQLFTYLLTQRCTACLTHIGLFTFASWLNKTLTAVKAEICRFRGPIVPKTVHPPPKLTHERHIPGMSTSPWKDSRCPKLCHLSCPLSQTPPWKYSLESIHFQFWGSVKPCTHIRTFFTGLHMRTTIHVFYFKNAQN